MNKFALASLLLLLQACEQVAVETVQQERIEVIVSASGELESQQTAMIAPPSIARMWQYQIKQLVPENSQVKKGQILVSFDDQKVTDRLIDKQADLARAEKELENKIVKEIRISAASNSCFSASSTLASASFSTFQCFFLCDNRLPDRNNSPLA